jgi:catechol 2,3-dioxygenase-like lactoylglutathione lyase family enzyme
VQTNPVVPGIDHIVLQVLDQEAALAFYTDELGLEAWRVEEWRSGAVGFPSARVNDSFIIDFVKGERTGTNLDHFCLVVEEIDFDALRASGRFRVQQGPATRSGARSDGTSLYIWDPDDNLVELRYY